MDVVSSVVAGVPEGALVFDALFMGRHIVVAVVESPNGGLNVSEDGQRTLNALRLHDQANGTKASVHMVEIGTRRAAHKRLHTVLKAAKDGQLVICLGRDAEACAGVVDALNVRRGDPGVH